jgi:hypothetical protein
LQDYLDLVLPDDPAHWKQYWGPRLSCALALGHLEKTRQILVETPAAVAMLNQDRSGLGDRLLALGQNVSADGRAEIASVLHEREAYSVEKLKVRHIWQKTQFPIEMPAG